MFNINKSLITGAIAQDKPYFYNQSKATVPISADISTQPHSYAPNFQLGVLADFANDKDANGLNALFREIYLYDSVSGPVVDLIANMPFSDWTITGVSDPKVLQLFQDSLQELRLQELMQELTISYLVLGKVIGSFLFSEGKGIFTDCIIHNPDFCEILPIPIKGYDPKINMKMSPEMSKFLRSTDQRDRDALKEIPQKLLSKLMSGGKIELEPVNTLYVERPGLVGSSGFSYYTRVLPIWIIEKALIRGTIIGAWKRQRSILHITAGTDEWEPTPQQLQELASLFIAADLDPQGAVVATRPGVETNELRSGSDFWKISEEADTFTNIKLRSLGVSEGFLSGEATWNCFVSDTYITTGKGILQIGEIANLEDGKVQDINLSLASRYKKVRAAKWLYSGEAPTVKIRLNTGNTLKCTYKEPVLSFQDNITDWKLAKDFKLGDYVCLSTQEHTRQEKLKLNLPEVPYLKTNKLPDVKCPEYMTPELAFILGCVVAEGSFNGNDVDFPNSNTALLDKFEKCVKKVFGKTCNRYKIAIKGDACNFKHTVCYHSKTSYTIRVCSKIISSWLSYLGVSNYRRGDKAQAYFKEVPWAVLQADRESQLAYLAAYIECDGMIAKSSNEVMFFSYSKKNLEQMQVLLSSHGLISSIGENHSLTVLAAFRKLFYDKIKRHLVSKQLEQKSFTGMFYGIPTEGLREFILKRRVGRDGGQFYIYKNDAGEKVQTYNILQKLPKCLSYKAYEDGQYTDLLNSLKNISVTEYEKVKELLKLKYYYAKIISIRDNGKQPVYDLSVEKGKEPAFVANGVVVHNTLEASMSTFLENIKSLRFMLTKRVIYDKIFLTLSKYHNIRRLKTAEIQHRVRVSAGKDTSDALNYVIPEIQWHKHLQPQADNEYLEVLNSAKDKGVPVTLRMLAAASGISIDKLMLSLDDDINLRKQIKEYRDKLKKEKLVSGGEGGEGGEGGMFGSTKDKITASELKAFKKYVYEIQDETEISSKQAGNIVKFIAGRVGGKNNIVSG